MEIHLNHNAFIAAIEILNNWNNFVFGMNLEITNFSNKSN